MTNPSQYSINGNNHIPCMSRFERYRMQVGLKLEPIHPKMKELMEEVHAIIAEAALTNKKPEKVLKINRDYGTEALSVHIKPTNNGVDVTQSYDNFFILDNLELVQLNDTKAIDFKDLKSGMII